MKTIETYLDAIPDPEQKGRMIEIFDWLKQNYPQLKGEIKWNQPLFEHEGTMIIGFSMAKHHMSFTPEEKGIRVFSDAIKQAGYEHTKGLAKIKWTDSVDYVLLKKIIDYNIADKAGCKAYFRKSEDK